MYVYSYEQLLAIVNQRATTIAQRDAVINNLRIEREWLEEDNKLQREEVEKANKKIADQDRFGKLKEKRLKHAIAVLPHSYSVTRRVRVLPKPTSETVIVPVPVNTVKETEASYRTILVAENVIQSFRRNSICLLNHSPPRDLNPIEFLLFNNNTCSHLDL